MALATELSLDLRKFGLEIEKAGICCRFCKTKLKASGVGCWGPHPGGIRVIGYPDRGEPYENHQWVYCKCSKCGYQWSLKKLRRWL